MAASCVCFQCCAGSPSSVVLDEELVTLGLDHANGSELPRKDYESLDYDICNNEPYAELKKARDHRFTKVKVSIIKWCCFFIIGLLAGVVAFLIDYLVKLLNKWKYSTVDRSIKWCGEEGCLVFSLLLLLSFNSTFVFISSCLVTLEPLAAGSGIPEIKSYLNGVKVPHVVRLKTLVSKAVGVLFSVAGGLFIGKEGPMIHSGAIIGAGIPQFQSITLQKLNFRFPHFRTDRDKRDFVSGGAAAGVAAAFGAPIGGVLFSLEEGCSFWNQSLTWRTFFCSMAATFSLNFFLSGVNYHNWGGLDQPGLIDFGTFKNSQLWTVVDLFIFIIMGFVGGLFGALFNALNTALTKHRMRHIATRHRSIRVLEAVLVGLVTTTVAFIAAMTLGECKTLHNAKSSGANSSLGDDTVRNYFCNQTQYNDMATLFFNTQETAIKQLFHQPAQFSLATLGIFFVFYFFLACWTYGAMVPSGLFIPCILCGAAYGRFVGNFFQQYLGYSGIYMGTFALIGAASFLGGVVRMTISLTVILIESTNEITYGFPIMVVLMVAKWTGDLFNKGLYDSHIDLRGIPFLEWSAPQGIYSLAAHEVMEPRLSFVYPHTRVQSLIRILRTTRHHAFPVVTENAPGPVPLGNISAHSIASSNILYKRDSTLTRAGERRRRTSSERSVNLKRRRHDSSTSAGDQEMPSSRRRSSYTVDSAEAEDLPELYKPLFSNNKSTDRDEDEYKPLTFHGIILRSHLVVLLKKSVYYSENTSSESQPRLSYEELTEDYPRYPDISDLDLSTVQPSCIMNLTPYMNKCPYTVSQDTPVPQAFNLFRTMGLRHLPVVNTSGEILGIITRHDLTHENISAKLRDRQNS